MCEPFHWHFISRGGDADHVFTAGAAGWEYSPRSRFSTHSECLLFIYFCKWIRGLLRTVALREKMEPQGLGCCPALSFATGLMTQIRVAWEYFNLFLGHLLYCKGHRLKHFIKALHWAMLNVHLCRNSNSLQHVTCKDPPPPPPVPPSWTGAFRVTLTPWIIRR